MTGKALKKGNFLFHIWLVLFFSLAAVLCINRISIAGMNTVRSLTLYVLSMLDLLMLSGIFTESCNWLIQSRREAVRLFFVCLLLTVVYILYCMFGNRLVQGITLIQDSMAAGTLLCILTCTGCLG